MLCGEEVQESRARRDPAKMSSSLLREQAQPRRAAPISVPDRKLQHTAPVTVRWGLASEMKYSPLRSSWWDENESNMAPQGRERGMQWLEIRQEGCMCTSLVLVQRQKGNLVFSFPSSQCQSSVTGREIPKLFQCCAGNNRHPLTPENYHVQGRNSSCREDSSATPCIAPTACSAIEWSQSWEYGETCLKETARKAGDTETRHSALKAALYTKSSF